MLDDYTLLKEIGKGAFGKVYLTSKAGTSQQFATKQIDKKLSSNPKAKKYLDNEIAILKELDHPNIVKLYEVKETSQYLYLVTEYCNGGDLNNCLENYMKKNNKAFPENIVQYLMKQIISALKYIHGKGILHRDIKLDNILVQFDNIEDKRNGDMLKAKVKLIDFGFARHLEKEKLAYSTLGSPINMDPGILRKLNKMEHSREFGYDEKADIWSLGTVCYELLIGKSAFDAKTMKELVSKVEKGNYFLPANLSKEIVSFLNGMLQYDFKKRLSSEQLSRHRFLTKDYNNLTKINLNDIKKKLAGSKIKINSKLNDSIANYFGTISQILDEIDEKEMICETDTDTDSNNNKTDNINKIDNNITDNTKTNKNKTNNYIDEITNKMDGIDIKKKKVNEKTLDEEFLKVFESMNDDCIYIEPKLIPIIPGNDPDIINKVSDFNDEF